MRLTPDKAREAAGNFRHIAKHLRSKSPDPRERDRLATYLDELADRYDRDAEA